MAVLVLSQHLEPTYLLELVGDDASGIGHLLKDRVGDVAEFGGAVGRVGVTASIRRWSRASSAGIGGPRSTSSRSGERSAVERHVQSIFLKLRLPDTEEDNRRVLAVLALLGH